MRKLFQQLLDNNLSMEVTKLQGKDVLTFRSLIDPELYVSVYTEGAVCEESDDVFGFIEYTLVPAAAAINKALAE